MTPSSFNPHPPGMAGVTNEFDIAPLRHRFQSSPAGDGGCNKELIRMAKELS